MCSRPIHFKEGIQTVSGVMNLNAPHYISQGFILKISQNSSPSTLRKKTLYRDFKTWTFDLI